MNREELLKKIQELTFAQNELALFLSTHEDNIEALEEFYRYREECRAATEAYEGKYGSLRIETVSGERFSFNDSPWPWDLNNGKGGR